MDVWHFHYRNFTYGVLPCGIVVRLYEQYSNRTPLSCTVFLVCLYDGLEEIPLILFFIAVDDTLKYFAHSIAELKYFSSPFGIMALTFFRKSMSSIQKKLLVCDFCGIIAFVLFLSGACHDSWVFYGLLFVAMVTYTDLFSMNKIFDKKPLI